MKCALFPISADPLTYGHLNIIEKALALCDEKLIIVLLDNYYKKPLLSLSKRLALTQTTLNHYFTTAYTIPSDPKLYHKPIHSDAPTPSTHPAQIPPSSPLKKATQPPPNARASLLAKIELVTWDGFLHDFMLKRNVFTVIRGLRTAEDVTYERTIHAGYQAQLTPLGLSAHFAYIMCDKPYQDISSSLVKTLALRGGTLTSFVPLPIKQSLEQTLLKQHKLIVTGSMGSGKSTLIPKLIEHLQAKSIPAYHIDMDKIVAELYETLAQGALPAPAKSLADYFSLTKPISKQAIRSIVFHPDRPDPKQDLAFLEQTLAPYIHSAYKSHIASKHGLLLIEAPQATEYNLLHESNGFVLVVTCSETERKKRLARSRNIPPTELQRRLSLAPTEEEKLQTLSHHIAVLNFGHLFSYNNSTPHTFPNLKTLAQEIISSLALKPSS